MRACRVALVGAGTGAGKFVGPRSGISGNVEARVVIHPVDQAILEYGISSGHSLWHRQRIANLAGSLRPRDIDRPKPVSIPSRKDEVLEDRRIVILLRD